MHREETLTAQSAPGARARGLLARLGLARLRGWWGEFGRAEADPFARVEGVETRLWLLAVLLIFLLAVAIYLLNAAAVVQELPRAEPLVALLANDATALLLLAIVFLICGYFHERLVKLRRENRALIANLRGKQVALERQNRQLTAWGDASHALIANFDLPRLLDLIVATALEVTRAERASVMLLDEKEGILTIAAARGVSPEVIASTRVRLGEGIAGLVAQTGQPLLLHRGLSPAELSPLLQREEEISSAISVPLFANERVVGTLNVSEACGKVELGDEEVISLGLFANQAALALEKAELYRESQRQLEKLLEVLDELGRTQAQLLHSEKLASVGVLAGGVAHEINNPLAVILGRTELLLMEDSVQGNLRRDLETIKRETERISEIVRGLLTFSRRSQQDHMESTSLNEVLERTLGLIQHQLTVNGVNVVTDLEPDLPPLQANPGQLQQVFTNMVINAFHAMPRGGELRVRTFALPGRQLAVEFEDTGCGIPPDMLDRIFDPFVTTKEEGQGTGLGLAISHTIVRNHGGEIGVTSQLGKGTCFRVILPLDPPSPKEDRPPAEAALASPVSSIL
jgi:signal transduction histidine kinase